jgi:hypothetical protein
MKYLILLVLLFDGTLMEERLKFSSPTDDCFGWGQAHVEAIATYVGPGAKQGWYLNDGRGTIQGFYCE